MAEKKKKYFKARTPAGTAAYAWLAKPDAKGKSKYGDDRYKVTLVLDSDADLTALEEAVREAAIAEWGKVPDDMVSPFKDGAEKGKEEFEGKTLITCKTTKQPGFFDAKAKPLPNGVFPMSGDLIKLSVSAGAYESTDKFKENGKVKTVTTLGVALYLNGVQLLEKRNNGFGNDFEEEDGYEGFNSSDNASDTDDDDGDF